MVNVTGLAHVGIRVTNFSDSVRFYQDLGFKVIRFDQDERVIVVQHASGIEINLLDSANDNNDGRNVLMDESVNYAGYTHVALRVRSIHKAVKNILSLGIKLTEGPVIFGDGSTSIFFRDPDRNVIELSEPPTKRKTLLNTNYPLSQVMEK